MVQMSANRNMDHEQEHEQAMAAMAFRESLIDRALQIVHTVRQYEKSKERQKRRDVQRVSSNFLAHELISLATELRDYGLRCVMVSMEA